MHPHEINDCNNITLDMGRSNSNIFLDQEASKTGVVQRLLPLTMPGPIRAHREWPVNGISVKPGNEPSQHRGHSGQEMPPKHGQI